MIISCGPRRLVSDRFGWKIEIQHIPAKGTKAGQIEWKEDRPAYPATLSQALEMVCERELQDQGDMAVTDLADALKRAAHNVREYMMKARMSA